MTDTKTSHAADKITWSTVKSKISLDEPAKLLALLQDLYDLSVDNKNFFHSRLALGNNVLKPYKSEIDRWLWPDVLRNQVVSVFKAKKAIADYKKAAGHPEHLAELMVFYCERAAGFSDDVGYANDIFFDALSRMFEQALATISQLHENARPALVHRLWDVANLCKKFGYGMDTDTRDSLAKYGHIR